MSRNCRVGWPRDEKSIYIAVGTKGYRVALPPGKMFPAFPAGGLQSEADLNLIANAQPFASSGPKSMRVLNFESIALGADPSTYAFVKESAHRNLYQIPIP